MSDYFFYDLNKKMSDLANKQQLAETAQATPANPAPNRLMEAAADYSAKKAAAGKDIGKPGKNFSKIAADAGKRYGSAEAGKRVAGAVLNKLRHTEESIDQAQLKPWKATMKESDVDESALQAAFGKKKYGDQGMKALQKDGRNNASDSTMKKIRNQYDKYDEGMTDEGNAFSGAVVKAKRDGIQPGEKITVGGKQYALKEVNATPQYVPDPVSKPVAKASAPVYAPGDMEGATAPPAKGKDGRYPIVTSGPHKGKRWSPATPGPTNPTMKEAAKYRDPKYKDKLYTQEPGDSDDYDSISYGYEIPERPANDPGQKRRMGGAGSDPLTRGFRMSADKSINTHGKRKGMPSRDQITSLKGSIKDVLGKHTEPNLPEGGAPMTAKQQKFAKLAPPVDKITFADKIVGAKQAAGGRNRGMDESDFDDTPTRRRSSSGGEIDTSEPGRTIHRQVKGNYSGAGHDVGADDEPTGALGRRKVGAGQGKKIGAKINRGTSKLMTREGDMPEDMIEPHDRGEYDQEGSMAKDDIKTIVRHAQALEQILSDNDNLPEWVQAKLAKIEGMMTAVDDYMQNQQSGDMPMDEESTNKRDNRAERAGRRVAKDIEYDEKKKDGIHGRRRGSEDDKAERAGHRVTKDIEYDEKHKKNESSDQHFDKGYYDSIDAAKKDNSKSIVKARKQPFEEESTNTRDSRAERAGRKVAKDIEYDEKKKDGIHGKRRGSEDDKAERAGRKVTKDIEYDEKKKKKKEVDETTSSGSVATGGAAVPKSSGSVSYGKGIYDSLNRQLENMISESMNINMSMNNDEHGGPKKSLTVTATDDDAVMLAGLLKMAGMGHGDEHIYAMTGDDSGMDTLHDMDHEEPCSTCGSSPCGCDDEMMDEDRWGAEQSPKLPNDMTVTAPGGVDVSKDGSNWVYKSKEPGGRVTVTIPAKAANKMLPNTEMDEAYGDTDASENDPDYPTDEVGTDDAMMYSGGLNGPKSTGQTTSPIVGGQDDRMGYDGLDEELSRMMRIAGLR
jgi:hypothetical protein